MPGLQGAETVSSPVPTPRLTFLDPPKVRQKLKEAFCSNVKDNGVLAFIEALLIPISKLRLDWLEG